MGELAAFVCSHLKNHDIDVILTGGGCVSIHTDGNFISYDLDFIENLTSGRRNLKKVLSKIKFTEHNRYFQHPDTQFFLEFPTGPLAVGNEPPFKIMNLIFETGHLSILSPTDCIKDRLAAYFHWDDRQCLDQAIQVANNNEIDLKEIKRWAVNEGNEAKFNDFRQKL